MMHNPFWADSDQDLQDAWKHMDAIKDAGKAKSIGVSNYLRPHLEATLATAKSPLVVNQIEFQPYLQRANEFVP
jgi:diketogulonate reductase-like aldo/keto reductase